MINTVKTTIEWRMADIEVVNVSWKLGGNAHSHSHHHINRGILTAYFQSNNSI